MQRKVAKRKTTQGKTHPWKAKITRLGRLRQSLIALARKAGTPLFVYDSNEATKNLKSFDSAFRKTPTPISLYYAIKSNPYPGLLATITNAGYGLDASSAPELHSALRANAKKIVLTGPAKGTEAIKLVIQHRDRVVLHLDSVNELKVVAQIAKSAGVIVSCGIRVCTKEQSNWRKFGIVLDELGQFFRAAQRFPAVEISGIHFHGGTLETPAAVTKTLCALGSVLPQVLPRKALLQLEFIDIGGGIPPEAFEGVYPWNRRQAMSFDSRTAILKRILAREFQPSFEIPSVVPIERFAKEISHAFVKHLRPINPQINLWAEPGKFISHSVMHFLLRVVDVKNKEVIIVDGGTNMVGWEKYEFFDYAPIFNLTHYDPYRERPFLVFGNLCTPHDLWGYYIRGKRLYLGDLLCLPYQGAYTFTLAQQFIRGLPPVADLPLR
ncbi:MAG: alanine racemase [Pseudomonadota bacterium]